MSKAKVSSFAATPGDLRQIVLDYLCDNCYSDTAQLLARDSSTRELDKDGDEVLGGVGENGSLDPQTVRMVRLRKGEFFKFLFYVCILASCLMIGSRMSDIKARILAGRIGDATELLNSHFPAVLSPRAGALPPYAPSHLFLNLRIQNFIEQSRTMSLPWPSDLLLQSSPSTQNSSPVHKLACLDNSCLSWSDSKEDEERKSRLLNLMNELYMLVFALPISKDRDIYQSELLTVGGLLAYPVPEKSKEMRSYLDSSRREAVADQINEAILFRTNVPRPSLVELIARNTTILFSTLNSLSHSLPPPEQRPLGSESLLSGADALRSDTKDQKVTKEVRELVPKFELGRLLGSDS
ncbi:hypothetical protein K439DRAFT_1390772 [Ramaria rubella]|nr:hypothetical protein K439DRAFT_1390772 [Ramaria rubella]